MSNELQILSINKPEQMLALANTLKDFIQKNELSIKIQDKPYAYVEAWQFAGSNLGLYPVMIESLNESTYEPITYKWKDRRNNPKEKATFKYKYRATVEIRRFDNEQVVSRGKMLCSNDEFGKHEFSEYAIESMAQTRAEGKAWRMLLAWIMKAAGYAQTPAEEMEDEKKDFFENCPTAEEKKMLIDLVYSSTLDEDKKQEALATIAGCTTYGLFQRIEYRLKDLQPSIHEIQNPLQSDINAHLKKAVKQNG